MSDMYKFIFFYSWRNTFRREQPFAWYFVDNSLTPNSPIPRRTKKKKSIHHVQRRRPVLLMPNPGPFLSFCFFRDPFGLPLFAGDSLGCSSVSSAASVSSLTASVASSSASPLPSVSSEFNSSVEPFRGVDPFCGASNPTWSREDRLPRVRALRFDSCPCPCEGEDTGSIWGETKVQIT